MARSSWKIGQWTTPTTQVSVPPVPSEVSPESRSQISHNIAGQFPSFIRGEYDTFIEFVKSYYKSQELRGYCFDIIQNWTDYYNIDNYQNLVEETELISEVSTTSTTIDVATTRDFPNEGLLMIDNEIIYYQSKGATLFQECTRGFDAVEAVGTSAEFKFNESDATTHARGTKVINLNNIFPIYMLGKFKEQFLSTYPKNFATGVTESTVIKRIKDFYASKGSTRSFQFVIRTLFGVDSQITYPRDRIFKPSDAFYTSREVLRAVAVQGNPQDLVGEVLYQEADPNDPNVDFARIYVKGVVEVFTPTGVIYEIDVDTNNALGTFVTPYKTILADDLSDSVDVGIVTVDSTLGWPQQNGRFRIQDEIISYAEKTVNQFIGCTRTAGTNVVHDAGQEVFAAFKIYGNSNKDGSEIVLKVYGGTRGVQITDGGRYYLPQSKVNTPSAPGFDSIDPIWDTFLYNVKRALRGRSATLSTPAADGSTRVTITTKEKHRLVRDDIIRILNAPEDIYNSDHKVVGVVSDFVFEVVLSSSPAQGLSGEFFISRETAFGRSDYGSINNAVRKFTADIQNTYKSDTDAIVTSAGVPSHKIGPFGANDGIPGNQRYLKRIPLVPQTKSTKTDTPAAQIGIGVNGVPFFSYKTENITKFGGLRSITKISGGDGYDITNPPTVRFEKDYERGADYAIYTRVKFNGKRYQALSTGTTSSTVDPTHTSGNQTLGTVVWKYEGESAEASVSVKASVIAINVTNGGTGYTESPIVSITGGGADSDNQASATAQITNGSVTGITVVDGGEGYTSVPTVSISGGNGTGATARAIARGPIDTITISDAGSQYDYEPVIELVSGSGAVAYPSILNGKIESLIVTFGGSGYFGAPDVIITGDGVGATAFANVDLTQNIVTSITVTNKGVGYTAGNTRIDIVYPGSGAVFQTKLTELTQNNAATYQELGVAEAAFTNPKTLDPANGGLFQGSNYLIYEQEYGYMYNPKKLRFLAKDNINEALQELTPTAHSPVLGWAYDGHPIYGPYGFEDPKNANPFNSYQQMSSSYRLKSSRDTLLSGLSAPMGTYIEDFEYVEGLGTLDRYNGRFCVTPEYPDGVYAYFVTVDGSTGNPKFPYIVGPQYYSQADAVNWNGNGLQKNFTENAIRYKAPYIGVDNIVAKRKNLDNIIDFFLALEDTTTLIVMEDGSTLSYSEDGIGYFSYYPLIRGGNAESISVSATNKYSSNNIDDYLIEGGGTGYKVNDRLVFDNTGTGGDGVSGLISEVTGSTINSITYAVDDDDKSTATLTTAGNHLLVAGDSIRVTIGNNDNTREFNTRVIDNKYAFEYFDVPNASYALSAFAGTTAYTKNTFVFVEGRVYKAAEDGTSAASGPTHTSGTATDGNMTWTFVRNRTDGNLLQAGVGAITGGSNYADGTYSEVPLTTSGNGSGAKATVVVSSGAVTTVTITSEGISYNVGDTCSADNINLGNNTGPAGSGFTFTITNTRREVFVKADAAHQLSVGSIVNVQPTGTDYTVERSESPRIFSTKTQIGSSWTDVFAANSTFVKEPKLQLVNGHKYKFDTQHSSNTGKTLAFTKDAENTNIFTYKNITETEQDSVTGEQDSITILVDDLAGIFYYFDIEGSVSGSYFTTINDPLTGLNTVKTKTDTTVTYDVAIEPESGYSGVAAEMSYTTNSVYPTGGVANINIGDAGRNYASLPKVSGTTRSGSGATAVATISGSLSNVSITNKGSGYNAASLPVANVAMPDFLDITLTNVFGSFVANEIVISQETQGTQTARGRVISWNPLTSVLRLEPLRNTRQGAASNGFIMFTNNNANTNKIISSDSSADISSISGTQAQVVAVVPATGPDVGRVSEITITNGGTNYRSAPEIIMADPYYGDVSTVGTITQSTTGQFTASTTFTGVAQKSVAPTGGVNVEFTIVTDGNGDISTVTVTDGGSTYALGDVITISGSALGGVDTTDDVTVVVSGLTHNDVVRFVTKINASVDSITITNSGSGYLSAPDIKVTGGNGINAKFNALLVNEGVSTINIENGGEQYTSTPVVNIEQNLGSGASILLKSNNLGEIVKISGDNITYNYSHDNTLKPELNTTYNLQLIRTQIIDYLDVIDGGANFVSTPEIILEGGSGSLFDLDPIIENEVIQEVKVSNPGRGFFSAPTVKAKVTHQFVALKSSSTINFPYNTKIPTGTAVTLNVLQGVLPAPLNNTTTYYAVAATVANGLGDNQIRLATSLANANAGTTITFTTDPVGGANGQTVFSLSTTDLGDRIKAYMKPATFQVGERIFQGASNTSFTASGFIKNWDPNGRVVSVEITSGEFKVGEPVFGQESSAFGSIHAFERAQATFEVSPISISSQRFERTTGVLDLNEQRLYDSDRFQEFSYNISSSININDWRNPLKFAAHPAGFKVVGTQIISESTAKLYRPSSFKNLSSTSQFDWWVQNPVQTPPTTFSGQTFIFPKPQAKNVGKLATINNFALGKPDYTASVPTEVEMLGRQLLDIQKILTCVAYKIDKTDDRTVSFDASDSNVVNISNNQITLTNHGFVDGQRVTYNAGGDRFQDARDLIIANIDYIVEETIGALNANYPSLSYTQATCARDTRLVVVAWANDLRYGGNYFTVEATNSYVGQVAPVSDRAADARNLLRANKEFIAEEAVGRMLQDPTVGLPSGFPGVPGGSQNCIDDVVDFIESLSYNVAYGGNSEVYDAANLYVGTVHLDGEEPQAVKTFEIAETLCVDVINNVAITAQHTSKTQFIDNTITNVVGGCTDVVSSMDTLFTILTDAISNDNLTGVTRVAPSSSTLHIGGEETETIFAYNKARDLVLLAINNNLPAGTYTSITPFVDESITNDPNNCANVQSAVTTLAAIITEGIDNPGTIPDEDRGNYPQQRTGTPIGGLTSGNPYFIRYVDANTVELAATSGGSAINFSAVGEGVGHQLNLKADGVNTKFKLRAANTDLSTKIAKTAVKSQLFVIINGIVQNPANYTFANDTITFGAAPLDGSEFLMMYYDRASYTSSFQLDQIGDEIKTFNLTDGLVPGYGYTDGSYTNVPLVNKRGTGSGATADITVSGTRVTNVVINNAGNGYTSDDIVGVSDLTTGAGSDPLGTWNYHRVADAARLIRLNTNFIATTAYGRMINDPANSGFTNPDVTKCIRDTSIIVEAVADNVEFGGNDATYDAAQTYVGSTHLTGEEDESVEVYNHARDICREVMRNITVTTNSETVGSQVVDNTITDDSGDSTYDTSDCADIASTITTLFGIVSTAIGSTGSPGNLNSITRQAAYIPEFQVKVDTVTFDGTDTTFSAQVGGSNYSLPASDNFLIFLNSTLQVKGSAESYTYTGSNITFNEAPLPGMDFYGFYFGKLTLLDTIAPFFDNSKKTFILKNNNQPFSLESDNPAVDSSNNLFIFLNGVFQEPGSAYELNGAIIEFTEAPRAGSTCELYIYTGSPTDVLIQNTYNSLDPDDRLQVDSEGADRRLAVVSSSSTVDTYEYTALKPTVAEFTATVVGGSVVAVNIINAGSNYEVPPILVFTGGDGDGASAQTVIEEGSGRVIGVVNLNGGAGYTSTPIVRPFHPVHVERRQRNRAISNSLPLASAYVIADSNSADTTIELSSSGWNSTQAIGFPDEGELMVKYFDNGNTKLERILYGAVDRNTDVFTVATGGRGYGGTTAGTLTGYVGTYTVQANGRDVELAISNTGVLGAHPYVQGGTIYVRGTSGAFQANSAHGEYTITNVSGNTLTISMTTALTAGNSGSFRIGLEVRQRSL